ncbi:integrase core domain-containing protein [Arthrobacter sp. STN4]|uniref:integrase core domain-containing protein n=1 Tax=Arthrobacter sp. STN4 TaxID=2923276 RepID=UPI00211A0336|nr:integrase core domain-containing protein [Arthrobacter sp. STN4]MCQ9162999.1 integrase core domain-containing protein [Arthrobacter sp. STN4]
MPKSLTPSVRRQIVEFDPLAADGPSVSEFCQRLGISRPSFYNIRRRFLQEGNKALNPRSSAPKNPVRTFGQNTTNTVLRIRTRLEKEGWGSGPKSIWFVGVDTGEFGLPVPSVATIARILSAAGAVKANPRKRPRSAWLRFARSAAMEMWQLDALEYRLADEAGTKVTIYQLLDDSTRFDVGTMCFPDPENGTDAIATLRAAFTAHGVPRELLSDNGRAFNQARQGIVSGTERFLADHGCLGISGRGYHPQTQGKNERSHQTLRRFLEANAPASLAALTTLITDFRSYYNYRRRHQALPGAMTPGQAWEAADHRPSERIPISHKELQARADSYRDNRLAQNAAEAPAGEIQDLSRTATTAAAAEPRLPAGGRLRDAAVDLVVVTRGNPQIYFQGLKIMIPSNLAGTYQVISTESDYSMFDTTTGIESVYFPLPIRPAITRRIFPLWAVSGARVRDQKADWTDKQRTYMKKTLAKES